MRRALDAIKEAINGNFDAPGTGVAFTLPWPMCAARIRITMRTEVQQLLWLNTLINMAALCSQGCCFHRLIKLL